METSNNLTDKHFKISSRKLQGAVFAQRLPGQFLLHTCSIDGQPHVIYPQGLADAEPEAFSRLQSFAHTHRLRLLEERRYDLLKPAHEHRRSWLPILLFTISANVAAEKPIADTSFSANLHLSSGDPQHSEWDINASESNVLEVISHKHTFEPLVDGPQAERILRLLQDHYHHGGSDPESMNDEIKWLADYYSQFPFVVELLQSLADLNWQLHYEQRSYRTEVIGSQFGVESANVFFDPNFAARLKFHRACEEKLPYCIASPADALLHELLHVRSILENPDAFIASGGMGGLLYPFEHERRTIEQENELYRSMTVLDGKPRPIRNDHTGRYVLVACSTCIE